MSAIVAVPVNEQRRKMIQELLFLKQEIFHREAVGHPGTYGMPDLLFPKGFKPGVPVKDFAMENAVANALAGEDISEGWLRHPLENPETDAEYCIRQNIQLKNFIESTMFVVKDARRHQVKTIPSLLDFIADIFFGRVNKAVVWKPRGGGGSLSAAVLLWLLLIYKKLSVLDMAGSGDQSKIVYDYVKGFFNCIPGLTEGLVDALLALETRLKTGVTIKCIPATQKQARGKHVSVVLVDEACQEDTGTEKAMRAGLQGALSEGNPIIVLLSTFHVPTGLFQEYWDDNAAKGFKRYHWNCFDTMQECSLGMEGATEEDPLALDFCKKCELTYPKRIVTVSGEDEQQSWAGCHGRARKSHGWATYESMIEARRTNLGTNIFEVEFANDRPNFENSIYDPELVKLSLCGKMPMDASADQFAVGIDWGLETTNSLCVILAARKREYIYIDTCLYMDHKLVSDVAEILYGWQEVLGPLPILADQSHKFNNYELRAAGYDLREVSFGTWKKFGIQNLSKYFVYRRVKIHDQLIMLIEQLTKFRRNTMGNIVKKEDHGPDSLMCVMMQWRFEDEFGADLAKVSANDVIPVSPGQARQYSFNSAGISVPTAAEYTPAEVLLQNIPAGMPMPKKPMRQAQHPVPDRKSGVFTF